MSEITPRCHNDQDSSNHRAQGDQDVPRELYYTQSFKKYGRYPFIAIAQVILIITITDGIYLTKSNFIYVVMSSLDINVQANSNEYHTPMTFHASLIMQTFLHSVKLNSDKSTYCYLYTRPTEKSSAREIITEIALLGDVQFRSKNLLGQHPRYESDIDIAFSQTSVTTIKALLEQPSLFTMNADCQANMIFYAYGMFPIPAKVGLIMDDRTEIRVTLYGTSYAVWQGSNMFSSSTSLSLSHNATAPSTTPSPSFSDKKRSHLFHSLVSFYQLSNSTFSVQNASSIFSATLLPFDFLLFPLNINMAAIEINLKPDILSNATNHWKLSVAPFVIALRPFSKSKVSSTISFTCAENGKVGSYSDSASDSSCLLKDPLASISQDLMLRRHSSVSTFYAGSNIYLYDTIASFTSQETSLKVPSSLVSPNFLFNSSLRESSSISSTIKFLGNTFFNDFIAFSYSPQGFDLHVSEAVNGIDVEIKGQYAHEYDSVKIW